MLTIPPVQSWHDKPCQALRLILLTILFLLLPLDPTLYAAPARVASIQPQDLAEYETAPAEVKRLIEQALALTKQNLTYTFGSNSPARRGMDCSGAVQYTLKNIGVEDVPRSSHVIYQWASHTGRLTRTDGIFSTEDPVFSPLRPGDLLFWEGTYNTKKRNPPISHVMIYLGTLKEDGQGVLFGSSDGRSYRGQTMYGVSVFDWRIPPPEGKSRFVAFAPVPGLLDEKYEEIWRKNESGDKDKRRTRSVSRPRLGKSILEKILN